VGALYTRQSEEPFVIESTELADQHADIPIVVLVDEGSEAEAEQMAAILQDQGRATVVGAQTSRLTHGTNDVDFPDGSAPPGRVLA
jgi:C-terminal processing protease CtpA/Prc